jgi:hypothetical protein
VNPPDAQHMSDQDAGVRRGARARRPIGRDPGASLSTLLPSPPCSLGGPVVHRLPDAIRRDRVAAHSWRDHLRHGGSRRVAHPVRGGRARRPCRWPSARSGGGRGGAADAVHVTTELPPRSRTGLVRRPTSRPVRFLRVPPAQPALGQGKHLDRLGSDDQAPDCRAVSTSPPEKHHVDSVDGCSGRRALRTPDFVATGVESHGCCQPVPKGPGASER